MRRKTPTRTTTIVVVVAALLLGAGSDAAATDRRPPTSVGDTQTKATSEWPDPETHGPDILEFAAETRTRARDVLGERYVEMWLDRDQDHFVVGVLDLGPSEAKELAEKLSGAVDVEVAERLVSRREMNDLRREAMSLRDEFEWSTVAVNYEQGTLHVGVPDPEDVGRARVKLEQATGIEVLTGDVAERLEGLFDFTDLAAEPRIGLVHQPTPALTDTQASLPIKGGKRIRFEGSMCTTGFVVGGAGGTYVLTAGHCAPNGTPAWMGEVGNVALGVVANNTYLGAPTDVTADAAVVHSNGHAWEPHSFVKPGSYRLVVAQSDAYTFGDPVVPYTWLCFTGQRTGYESCGYVDSISAMTATIGKDGLLRYTHNTFSVLWTSGPGVLRGDSGGGAYGVVADGSAIAIGLLHACAGDASGECAAGALSYFSKIGPSLTQTGTTLKTAGRPPFGFLDAAAGGSGTVGVSGWVIDPDLSRTPTTVHVYVGGPAGSGAPGYSLPADTLRPDVAAAYPYTGTNHGYGATITTPVRGTNIPVYVYGIDIGGSHTSNPLLNGGVRYVNIY